MRLEEPIIFTIPVEPKTKKNSQQIIINRKTNRPIIIPSKDYKDYEKACMAYIPRAVRKEIDSPVIVKAIYFRQTRRRVDIANLEEALHDVLVLCKVLVDDNCSIIVGTDGSRVRYDKVNPRTEVYIYPTDDVQGGIQESIDITEGENW